MAPPVVPGGSRVATGVGEASPPQKKDGCYGFIHEKKCTVSHFGNLLLKEFGGKCSFRDGGALYDGKDTVDFELRKEIQSEFDMIKLARQ